MGGWRYLGLADYLLIAEGTLGLPAREIARLPGISLAESALAAPAAGFGDEDAYSDFATKAAVLCWHLVRNHPLPDGNKRVGFLALLEFCELNGRPWQRGERDPGETVAVIESVAAGELSIEELAAWVEERT